MWSQLWDTLLDYLKRMPYWQRIEPVLLAGFMYVGAVICAFQFVQWRYGVTLELPLFLQSYLFRQTTVAFAAILASFLILTYRLPKRTKPDSGSASPRRPYRLVLRFTAVFLIVATALFVLQRLAPAARVSSIRVMFAPRDALGIGKPDEQGQSSAGPAYRSDALTYVIFKLNEQQRTWHFEIDFSRLAWNRISGPAEERCRQDPMPSLCFAKAYYHQERAADAHFPPLVLIVTDPLGMADDEYYFWLYDDKVSVITTRDWEGTSAPTLYEYLAYSLILQGVLIHLDAHCGGKQVRDPSKQGVIYGNVFEYLPRRESFKAAILAGQLGPDDERLLLNCFGPEYLTTTSKLLRLDWLRTDAVRSNLRTVYGIEIAGSAQ